MTLDEIYQTARAHAYIQQALSLKPLLPGSLGMSVCLYLGPTGLKCAIGGLLPPSLLATMTNEEGDVNDLLAARPDVAEALGFEPWTAARYGDIPVPAAADVGRLELLVQLQEAHDSASSVEEWRLAMAPPTVEDFLAARGATARLAGAVGGRG